jgi:hypothetical protein
MCQPNKENLIFVGHWITEDGTIGIVKDGVLTIEECEFKNIIGLRLPIDSLGKCSISPKFDLKEKIRDSEGHTK